MFVAKGHKSSGFRPESATGRAVGRNDPARTSASPERDSGGAQLFLRPAQAKPTVGAVDDEFEREADHVAQMVMRMTDGRMVEPFDQDQSHLLHNPHAERGKSRTPLYLHGLCGQCEGDGGADDSPPGMSDVAGGKSNGGVVPSPPDEVAGLVHSSSGGRSLPQQVESHIGSVLGVDLGHVKVHDDHAANDAAHSIHAKAFTCRNHIYLGKSESVNDVRLMAHEVAHVVQQGAAGKKM